MNDDNWRGEGPTQSVDGTPHFAYHDPESDLSFVWAGNFDDPIEVCPGGYGKPVQFRLSTDLESFLGLMGFKGVTEDLTDVLATFQTVCQSIAEIYKMLGPDGMNQREVGSPLIGRIDSPSGIPQFMRE